MWLTRLRSSKPKEGLLFGLELEIEGSGLQEASNCLPTSMFVVENDGSLRNGLEVKSRSAYDYNKTLELVSKYDEFLSKCTARATPRTSVHIHVNTQDMTDEQLRSMIWLSVAMEPVLLRFCSALRNHNAYCIPVYNSTNLVRFWRQFLRWLDTPNSSSPPSPSKYAATGAFRLYDLGTLEFRMFPGCTNSMKLRWYLDILSAMYSVARSADVQTLRDKKQSEGLLSLITNVIIDNRKSVSLVELESLIDIGIQMANDIFRTPVSKESVLKAYAELFPSKFKPVTSDTLLDLFNAKSLTEAIKEYDPEDLLSCIKGKAFETYRFLVASYPDQPVKVANFVQELSKLGVIK